MKVLSAFLLAAMLAAAPVIAQDKGSANTNQDKGSANTNMEILMEKVKADKKLLVAANLELTDDEGKNFWPLYDAYQKELEKQNQQLSKTIMEYADAYNKGPIPDDTSKKLLKQVFAVENAQVKTKHEYAAKIEKVLSASKTARYIQIETKIRAALMYELAKRIPLVE